MIIKNTKLEQKLKDTQKELEHCKSLLQGFLSEKENFSKEVNSPSLPTTPQSVNEKQVEYVAAPRKSVKHVSFAEDYPRPTLYSHELEENVDKPVNLKGTSILKASKSQDDVQALNKTQAHNVPMKTKEIKVLSRDGSVRQSRDKETAKVETEGKDLIGIRLTK